MKVSTEKQENRQVTLVVEAEPGEVQESLQKAYLRLVKQLDIPGFRKGKAPRAILERYVGKGRLQEEAIEHLLPKLYEQALQEQGIENFAEPELEIIQRDPLKFKAAVPLRPLVELGDYTKIRLTPEPAEVDDKDVDSFLERLRSQKAPWEPVERPVQSGDIVTVDVERRGEGESPLEMKDSVYLVLPGSSTSHPGFIEQLMGMEKGQEKEFELSYPADYENKELASKQYHFKVKLKEIKGKRLAELNDEFAKSVGEGVETLAALRERIAKNLKLLAEARARRRFEETVLEATATISRVEFPPFLEERELERLLVEQAENFGGGERGLENYLKQIDKSLTEAKEQLRPEARKRLTYALLLDKIGEVEKIEVSPKDVETEIEERVKRAGEKGEELRRELSLPEERSSLEKVLLSRKSLQHLVDIAASPVASEEVNPPKLESGGIS